MKPILIDDDNDNNNDNTNQNKIYYCIYNNIEEIKKKYGNILNPNTNKTTRRFLDENYSENEAYALSFMTTIIIYLNILGINHNFF